MNLTPEILLAALEKGLSNEDWLRMIAALRELPKDSVFSLASQGNITATGDGIVFGNNNHIFVVKGELQAEAARILIEALEPRQPPIPQDRISIARLPRLLTPHLFGREDELALLDRAWADPHTNIFSFVAWGGVGKSALISHWLMRLEQENYRDAEYVYTWSFYSQGTSDHAATAEYFVNDALRWFGGDAMADQLATASPWEKGERLARLIRQARTLLILDGLEPVQHPPGPQEGRLKEQSLQALLRELAAQQPGLCVITTREAVGDLTQYEGRTVVRHDLTNLSPQAGTQLLRELEVKGIDAELEAAVGEYGGHSLALTLLGSYLGDVYTGDAHRRHEIESLEEDVRHGWQVRRMMRAYEKWLSERQELAMLDVLWLLGLFDRPADAASVNALRAAPAIPGLTEAITSLDEKRWRQTLQALRRIRLLADAAERSPDTLDAHPLVREHFRAQLKAERPDAWRAGNLRLYEHLTRTAKELPDTLDEMAPLFASVTNGCEAGCHQKALDEVYWRRIHRGQEFFSTKKLGAFGADLSALIGFFTIPWRQPSAALNEAAQVFVLTQAGFDLPALGRLQEALQPMQTGLATTISRADWENAAAAASNISELTLTLGGLPQALAIARESVELAYRTSDSFWRMGSRITLADALHQAGHLTESAAEFRAAETMQQERLPQFPCLYSMPGFKYCDLLLGQRQFQEVQSRAVWTLEWSKQYGVPLLIALDQLTLGRAWLLQAAQPGSPPATSSAPLTDMDSVPPLAQAAACLDRAVAGLWQAGDQSYIPRGLLARAACFRLRGAIGEADDFDLARADLDEAFALATHGEMRLHLADCHLEAARLSLATGDREKAREHWVTAKAMIEEIGYHRRDKDVAEIAQQLEARSS